MGWTGLCSHSQAVLMSQPPAASPLPGCGTWHVLETDGEGCMGSFSQLPSANHLLSRWTGHCGGGNPSPASPKPCPDELGHNCVLEVQESKFTASPPPLDQEFCFVKKIPWPPGRDLCCVFSSTPTPPPLHPGLHVVSLPRTLPLMMFKHHPTPSQVEDPHNISAVLLIAANAILTEIT